MSSSSIDAEVVEAATVEKGSATDSPSIDPEALRRAGEVSRHRLVLAGSILVLILAAVLSVQSQTSVVLPLLNVPLPELCAARIWAGVSCPGCGMTRCFISAMHGDLPAAWHYNPAGLLALAVIMIQLPYRSYRLRCLARGCGGWEFSLISTTVIYLVFTVGLIVQWAARFFIIW